MRKDKLLKICCTLFFLSVALTLNMVFVTSVSASQADHWANGQFVVQKPEIENSENAYIVFSKDAQMNNMSFVEPNGAKQNEELYSEQVVFGGIDCRQVFAANKFYLKVDEDFANKDDRVFSLSFDYWNYGGGGYIYLDYYPIGSNEVSTLTILKLGLDENGQKTKDCWYRATVSIADIQLGSGKMEYGADFRIRSGAYNAFSKFEVKNLSQNAGDEFLGVCNNGSYNLLQEIGSFPSYDTAKSLEFFSKTLTREEAVVMMIKGYGMEEEALKKNLKTSFSDIKVENAPYVAFAETMGVLEHGEILNTNEPFYQEELVRMYLKLMSIDIPENVDVYALAIENGLVKSDNLIFQPKRLADMDSLSGLSLNALMNTNKKTGYNAFTKGVELGDYSIAEFVNSGNQIIIDWMKNNSFKLPKKTHYDETTGRTYYSVNFFGLNAAKSYYTMNCMANDNKRLYFIAMEKYVMEYNIETEICRYIDVFDPSGSGCLVTPLDNLWYINPSFEIIKVDLDTYEKEVVATLPKWQTNARSLQVNNDESKLSVWFITDGSGEIDNKKESRLPLLDLKTGEWDLRYKYGFSDTGQGNPNHMCINPNPEYDNLLFFAHEGYNTDAYTGRTGNIPDRTWLLDYDTGVFTNIIKQKWYVSPDKENLGTGRVGEGGCHEAWTYDGEWIFNVSNTTYTNSLPFQIHDPDAMIVMVRKDGTDKRLITMDYSMTQAQLGAGAGINHTMISYDNRFMAADCQYLSSYNRSDLYIGDAETGETHLLAITKQKGVDPGHTHPQFSPNDQYVIFGQWSDDLSCAEFAWMDVSDITNNPSKGAKVEISDSCEVLSYECDMEHSIKTVFDNNGAFEFAKVGKDHYMYVDVKKEIVESDNTPATIEITYKDDTRLPIKLVYYTWNENAATRDINVLKENVIYINRNATGKTITKTFKFDDICLGNMHVLGSDFKIGAVGAEATILSVDVLVKK